MPRVSSSFPKKPLTAKQFQAMRAGRQAGVIELLNALHDADFRSLLVESTAIGAEDYWLRIIVDEKTLDGDRLTRLKSVVESMGATLTLRDDHDRGIRLVVWMPHV